MDHTREGRTSTKAARLNIRTSEEEKRLVEQAARCAHVSTSAFVMQAAVRSAEEVLADQTRVILPPDGWDAFAAMLDRPAREVPALKKALGKSGRSGGR